MKKKICMVVQNPMVKGGIAAVVNGYKGSKLEEDFNIIYVESYKDGSKLTKLMKGICGYFHFAKVLLFDKPDIVHIHSSFGPSFYRKLPFIYMATWFKKSVINHIHGAEFNDFYENANNKKRKLIKKTYNKCSILVALSDEWKQNLLQIVPDEKIVVIENYSIIHADAVEERLNRKSNNQVLFLGEIGKRKGCYDIPEVVERVVKEISDVKFILGGSGDIEQITEILRSKGVEKNVVFPGWVRGEDKDHLLRESDVFFLPSYNEGMPMSILDAIGYGLPVVSTDVGGIPKIVHQGMNGYICKPGNIIDFVERLVYILSNEIVFKDCCRYSSSIANRCYSLEIHIGYIRDLYWKMLKTY